MAGGFFLKGCGMDSIVKDYKKDPPVINVTKTTLDRLFKEDKPDQLIALYLFYCYTSAWQDTLQIYATTSYTAKAMGWSVQKLQRIKRRLAELGLIQDVKSRNGQRFGKSYVRVYYYTFNSQPVEFLRGLRKQGAKCLVTNSNKCLDTGSRQKTSGDTHSKDSPSKKDIKRANTLRDIILSKRNVQMNIRGWPEIFRKLRQINKVSPKRIKRVLKWYARNIGGEFVPVAYSAQSFREKFTRIEDAMGRQIQNGVNKRHETGEFVRGVKTRRLKNGREEVAIRYDEASGEF